MILKIVFAVTLLTNCLSASDVFSVRSFTKPDADAKIPVDGMLFSAATEELKRLATSLEARRNRECSIPLLIARTSKTNDKMGMSVGQPSKPDPRSVIPPPVPVCKNWQ